MECVGRIEIGKEEKPSEHELIPKRDEYRWIWLIPPAEREILREMPKYEVYVYGGGN